MAEEDIGSGKGEDNPGDTPDQGASMATGPAKFVQEGSSIDYTPGADVLAGADPEAIVRAAQRPRPQTAPRPAFGDGHAAEKIVEILEHDPPHG